MSDVKVLIIEDDPVFKDYVKKILVNNGFEVLEATDGAEGLRIFREERPRILIVDIHLPDIDGLELIKRLRGASEEQERRIIIFASSADEAADLKVDSIAYGADEYILKPVSEGRLLLNIRNFQLLLESDPE